MCEEFKKLCLYDIYLYSVVNMSFSHWVLNPFFHIFKSLYNYFEVKGKSSGSIDCMRKIAVWVLLKLFINCNELKENTDTPSASVKLYFKCKHHTLHDLAIVDFLKFL